MSRLHVIHYQSERGMTFRHDWSIRDNGSLFAWGRVHCCGVVGDTQKRTKMGVKRYPEPMAHGPEACEPSHPCGSR